MRRIQSPSRSDHTSGQEEKHTGSDSGNLHAAGLTHQTERMLPVRADLRRTTIALHPWSLPTHETGRAP